MNTHNTRTYYLRNVPRPNQKRGDPIACLMTSIDRAGNVIKYSLATMHPKDDFKKDLGRKIAAGRLEENPAIVWVEAMPTSGHIISRMIMTDIVARFEQASKFNRDYILRTYGNNWAYHIPARVAKAAQRWLDDSMKPREIDSRGKTEKQIMTEALKTWTTQDLTSKSTTPLTCDPTTIGFIKYGNENYGEWVKNGKDFVRESAQEVEVKKTPKAQKTFATPEQQANYEAFLAELPNMLTNKFLRNKFVVVYGREVMASFDTFESAYKYALVSNFKSGVFVIQEVNDYYGQNNNESLSPLTDKVLADLTRRNVQVQHIECK
jgi:hypothetical protein